MALGSTGENAARSYAVIDLADTVRRWSSAQVRAGIAAVLPWIIRWELRRGLRGVWQVGPLPDLPSGGFILAANHHAWWDVYLAWLVAERLDRRMFGMMGTAQLERFPFFRDLGVVSDREVRTTLRRLEAGEGLILFPEGRITSPGRSEPFQPGLAYLAERASVPVLPVAMRVALRGARRPEAYLAFGAPVPQEVDVESDVRNRLDTLLADLDARLAEAHPEDVPADAQAWVRGRPTSRERSAWWERWWRA